LGYPVIAFYEAGETVEPKRERRTLNMAKKSRGGRMTAAKKRAAKSPGGKGRVKDRKAGRKIMKT
jgi:hypothetical protein